jgi:formylglycine-generating enzyme required for sulfatase activity
MADIFLSYKNEDRQSAEIIARALEGQGYTVWWDPVIPPGKTFDEVIEEELDAAHCVIVLWSRESVRSSWIKTEASEGNRRGVLIPVLIDNVLPPLAFRMMEAAKLIEWDGTLPNPEFDLLLGSIARVCGRSITVPKEKPGGVLEIEIKGTVSDETDHPVEHANITFTVDKDTIQQNTDKNGSFSFNVSRKHLTKSAQYEVKKEGFQTKTGKSQLKEKVQLEVTLSKDTIQSKFSEKLPPIAALKWPIVSAILVIAIFLMALPLSEPMINSFEANPHIISPGAYSTLSWDVSKATSVTIEPELGKVLSIGTHMVSPASTTTYTLTARNILFSKKVRTVEVTVIPTPEILFSAHPVELSQGDNTTLTWRVSGATKVTIEPEIGSVESEGEKLVSPHETTTYILTATNEVESVSTNVRVIVTPKPEITKPEINFFRASPRELSEGEETTLTWSVSGATKVTIEPEIGNVKSEGEEVLSPDKTTTYTLTATNEVGSIDKTVKVIVEQRQELSVSPNSFDFKGSGTQTLTLSNRGGGTLTWEAQDDEDWITLSKIKGTISERDKTLVDLNVNADGMEIGNYKGTITINSDGGTKTVPVNLIVSFSLDMEFVEIPAGEFDMGSPSDEVGIYEGPVHRVTISKAFKMGKYEVTQKQWREVMGTDPSYFKGDDLPVESVSWDEVQEFINKLNEKEGTTNYRLPSEAEWEYAARAGTTTRYSFGDDESKLGEYAWYDKNSGGKTHPVGQKQPNPWGLYDMHGNVCEWVQDTYHINYDGAPIDGTAWEDGNGADRVVRDGCWYGSAGYCRSAVRLYGDGVYRDLLGFRLLQEV